MNKLFYFLIFLLVLQISFAENIFASSKDKSPHLNFPARVQFIENKHQWEDFIKYEADFKGGKLFLEQQQFTYLFYNPDDMKSLHPNLGKQIDEIRLHALRIHAHGSNAEAVITGDHPANYFNNYFIGDDSAKWAHDVKLFSSVTYQNIYSNIDLKFYSSLTDIKYDMIVHPNGDASLIELEYEGADKLSLKDKSLQINLSVGTIVEQKPYAYQMVDGKETEVECRFVLKQNKISFKFPHGYNKLLPLIIDPTLIFSSYTGSTADNWGYTATYDAAGNVYAGGTVNGIGYPVTAGAYQATFQGGGNGGGNTWQSDIAIAKFNSTGTTLLYATYLGGSDNEEPHSLVVDGNDDLVVFGTTFSTNFPTTIGAYDRSENGAGDMIISKLSSSGNALLASTYIGGTGNDGVNINPAEFAGGSLKYNYGDQARGEIIVDANNNYIVGSCTPSSNFPVTPGAMQPTYGGGAQDGILFNINSSLTVLLWSTFIGGSGDDAVYDCVIDNSGNIYIAGGTNSPNFQTTPGVLQPSFQGGRADGFIAHINNGGNFFIASTYIGTPQYDQCYFVELDNSGNVYTTGQTEGAYPVTPGVYSNPNSGQFIHKMDAGLTTTFYSTVFGSGSNVPNISPTAFLVDTCENVYVAGWGRCIPLQGMSGNNNGMALTGNAFQSTTDGCDFYFFVLDHDADTLLYASYFGGSQSLEHVDGGTSRFNKNGTIYESVCAGCGGNDDFPTTPGVVSRTDNSFNCNNGVIKLSFNLARTVSGITTSPSSGCAPFTLTFQNNSINATSYLWDFDDGSPADTNATPTHTFVNTGTYHVMLIAMNRSSCNHNDTTYATIVATPTIPLDASFNLIPGLACDTEALVQFTGISGNFSQYDFGDGFTSYSLNTSHTYADTGTYLITHIVRDTSCAIVADTATQSVTFGALTRASVAAAGAVQGCAPFSVTFNNGSTTNGNHFWNFMDGSPVDTNMNTTHIFTSSGTYDVLFVVTDPFSCNGNDTAHVQIVVPVSTPLSAAFDLIQNPSCDSMEASMNFTGTGGTDYHWYFGDGFQSVGVSSSHQYTTAGNYSITLVATDSVCDRTDSSSQRITFRPNVKAGVETNDLISGCVPQEVELSNRFSSSGTHTWYFGDGTTFIGPSIQHTYRDTGLFTIVLIVTDTASCNLGDTAFYSLRIYPNPLAGFTHDQQDLYFINNDIGFYDRSFDAAFYRWNFGDGESATDSVVRHQFRTAGTYDICLAVSSSNGCIDSTCMPLDILASETIYFPNAFTPNGDGKDDVFKIYYFGLTDIDVTIFDRWGEKIYEYTSLSGSWDGTCNGRPVPEDVYVFRLKAKGIVSNDIVKYGKVTLIR